MTYYGANGNMQLWMGSNLNSTGSGHTGIQQGTSSLHLEIAFITQIVTIIK